MAYQINEKSEIEVSGFENGIATSPHKGIANIQNANISTESGEVLASFDRVLQSQTLFTTTGTITPGVDSDHINLAHTQGAINAGIWIHINSSNITNVSAGSNYYILSNPSSGSTSISLTYNGAPVASIGSTGTGVWSSVAGTAKQLGQPVTSATEPYSDGTTLQYRYYILDNAGLVWTYDTGTVNAGNRLWWFLSDPTAPASNITGMAVMNGYLMLFSGQIIYCKLTSILGSTSGWLPFAPGNMLSPATSINPHVAFVGHQGKLYYTDGNYIGSIFPNTSLVSSVTNIQSYAQYTASTVTGTYAPLIAGSIPATLPSTRIPATFIANGTLPTDLQSGDFSSHTISKIWYIEASAGAATFQVFAAASGGSAIDLQTGASGAQYFNTYCPVTSAGTVTITFTQQRLTLPFFEISQSIAEQGNTIVIGCKGNILYPWNQIDVLPGDLIALPENNVVNQITVNNMIYVFAGSKGNIYITNGSTASLVTTVPDYCAGVPGTPSSYIEPYFVWGGGMYVRGRVYFSILDQTATKTGNCGGIWSFTPTQNFYIGQDVGISLRIENKSSYLSYNGYATVLLPAQTQNARSPQFWSGWQNSYTTGTSTQFGIDFTDTNSTATVVVETDLIPTGSLLEKKTFSQVEYKLSAPLNINESVAMQYRQNGTDAWVTCGAPIVESTSTALSGYFPVPFEKGQWLQLQVTMTPSGTTSTASMCRLKQLIIR